MEAVLSWINLNRRRVLSWFKDDVFRRLFLNAGKLLSAKVFASIVGLITAVLTARALGPDRYGILALVLAYQLTIGKLVTFNAWQAIIKFGSETLQANDRTALRQLIKFGFCLDIGSAVIGTILAIVLADPIVRLLGWDHSVQPLLMLYSMLILVSLSGTPIGILRLFDRFDLLSVATVLEALIRIAGVAWCLFAKRDLRAFVLAYLVAKIMEQLCQLCSSFWVLHKQGIGNCFQEPLRGLRSRFHGLWGYVWTTNITMTVRMLSREADSVFVAALTTPDALGLFKVAKQFAAVLPALSDPLSQSIYPELARAWARRDKKGFISLIKRTTLFTSVAAFSGWVVFLLLGRWIIDTTVGAPFQGAYWVTVFYMLAMVVFLCSFAFTPSLLAMGLVRESFLANLAATVVYFCLLFPLVRSVGIAGASLSYIGFFLTWSVIMVSYLSSSCRRRVEAINVLD